MTVEELEAYCREHWPRIREELLSGRTSRSRCGGWKSRSRMAGVRMLGIPTVLDRMIQQALLQVLTPLFDPTFSDDSYGFRPGRSAHQAVGRAREHIAAGHRWVVDLDLEKFFDRVNHDVLMARVARRVKDKRVLRLIRPLPEAGMMEGGLVSPRTEGTPQGGPLSPLLSNILLDELGQGAGATRTPFRALRRRLQRVRAVAGGGRAGDGIAGALLDEATPAEGESGQERGGAALEPQVSGLQRHGGTASPS